MELPSDPSHDPFSSPPAPSGVPPIHDNNEQSHVDVPQDVSRQPSRKRRRSSSSSEIKQPPPKNRRLGRPSSGGRHARTAPSKPVETSPVPSLPAGMLRAQRITEFFNPAQDNFATAEVSKTTYAHHLAQKHAGSRVTDSYSNNQDKPQAPKATPSYLTELASPAPKATPTNAQKRKSQAPRVTLSNAQELTPEPEQVKVDALNKWIAQRGSAMSLYKWNPQPEIGSDMENGLSITEKQQREWKFHKK